MIASLVSAVALSGSAAHAGWSEFLPSTDSRIIYVSSSQGNDNNNGLSPNSPVKTIHRGYNMLRNGKPDWLLLRRGDTWYNEGFTGSGKVWAKSGRSEAEPVRLAAYGSATQRPRIVTSGNGFESHSDRRHVAITGIHFQSANGGSDGMRLILGYAENWLIEDCMIEGYQNNLNVQGFGSPGEIHNFQLRRSVIVDAASTGGGHSQGIYAAKVYGMLIEECVFDHNGWSQMNNSGGAGYPTVFNHNLYIATNNRDVEIRGNIICDGSSHGLQLRPGGAIEGNLFVNNPLSILLGGGDPDPDTHTHGITGTVIDNVVLHGRDINPATPRGFGIDLTNVASATVRNNVVAHLGNGSQPRPFTFLGTGYGSGVGVRNVQARDNVIYNWGGSVQFTGGSSALASLTFRDNDIQVFSNDHLIYQSSSGSFGAINSSGNRCYTNRASHQWCLVSSSTHSFESWRSQVGDSGSTAVQVNYPDPDRTTATYNQSLGGSASHSAFMTEARKQSKSNWRPQYTADAVNAYIRAGFGMN